ncbi:MAG TPA: DASS family sodium-coupled anion symporter [Longimicrobiaceae bacterium]|nr:DASS family sodium-coupled anion symporter [Longimicrobiaceae bacterium]
MPARRRIGLPLGPAALLAVLLLPPPAGMEPAAWRTAGVGILMAVWWMSEAVPIPATALLPLLLFPLLGVAGIDAAAAPYANPVIFLFLGGFMLAQAMQKWGLHRRVALEVIRAVGTRPASLVAGFMAAAALLSMWVSNTATAVMMLPIGVSVVELVCRREGGGDGRDEANFAAALMLGIAYACSIGGLGTLIGTPPNALLAGFMRETYGVEIGFGRWMLLGVPLVLVGLPLTWALLVRWAHPFRIPEVPGGAEMIRRELRALGPPSRGEAAVAAVFFLAAASWIFRPLLERVLPGLSDAGIAVAAALLLFALPVHPGRGEFALDWEWARRIPWEVLLLFGGGLSLAGAIARTGLAGWIGAALSALDALPTVTVVAVVATVVIFLTELTSNTATAAAFLPVVASLAGGIGEDPLLFAVPAALAASCAFMMPVATPPNAIVYGSGAVTVPQMARAGFLLNLAFVVLVTLWGWLLAPVLL